MSLAESLPVVQESPERLWTRPAAARLSSPTLTLMIGPMASGKTFWLSGSEAYSLGIRRSQIVCVREVHQDLGETPGPLSPRVWHIALALVRARAAFFLDIALDHSCLDRVERLAALRAAGLRYSVRYVLVDSPDAEAGVWAESGYCRAEFEARAGEAAVFQQQLAVLRSGDGRPTTQVIDRVGVRRPARSRH